MRKNKTLINRPYSLRISTESILLSTLEYCIYNYKGYEQV